MKSSRSLISALSTLHSPLFTLFPLLIAATPAPPLPPPDDIPEEVLRTEIITEARSPIDGKPLTASEYAELEEQLQHNPQLVDTIDQRIRNLIFLLRIRHTIRTIIPFFP